MLLPQKQTKKKKQLKRNRKELLKLKILHFLRGEGLYYPWIFVFSLNNSLFFVKQGKESEE